MKRTVNQIFYLSIVFVALSCSQSNEEKADKLNKDGNTKEAISFYEKAIAEGSVEAMNKLALLYSNEHQPEKATEWYQKSFDKGNVDAAKYLASSSLRDDDYEGVVKYAKALVDNGNTDMIYNLGSAYLKLEQYDQAISYLLKKENDVYVKDILGQAYYGKKDFANAEKCWKSGVDDFKSGGVNSYHNLLKLYQEQNRMEDYNKYKGRYEE
jgi:TPR repeat protein